GGCRVPPCSGSGHEPVVCRRHDDPETEGPSSSQRLHLSQAPATGIWHCLSNPCSTILPPNRGQPSEMHRPQCLKQGASWALDLEGEGGGGVDHQAAHHAEHHRDTLLVPPACRTGWSAGTAGRGPSDPCRQVGGARPNAPVCPGTIQVWRLRLCLPGANPPDLPEPLSPLSQRGHLTTPLWDRAPLMSPLAGALRQRP